MIVSTISLLFDLLNEVHLIWSGRLNRRCYDHSKRIIKILNLTMTNIAAALEKHFRMISYAGRF